MGSLPNEIRFDVPLLTFERRLEDVDFDRRFLMMWRLFMLITPTGLEDLGQLVGGDLSCRQVVLEFYRARANVGLKVASFQALNEL